MNLSDLTGQHAVEVEKALNRLEQLRKETDFLNEIIFTHERAMDHKEDAAPYVLKTTLQPGKVEYVNKDMVEKPSHYQGKVECIDAIEAACEGLNGVEAYLTGTTLKYIYRWKKKNGAEDLRKARQYLNRLLNHIEGKSSW